MRIFARLASFIGRGRAERELLGVALDQDVATAEAARRLREERLREVESEAAARRERGEQMARAAADLEHPVGGLRRQQGEDAANALPLDVADQEARVTVELLDVVLLDHCVVPRLELAPVTERELRQRRPTGSL